MDGNFSREDASMANKHMIELAGDFPQELPKNLPPFRPFFFAPHPGPQEADENT